MAKLCPTCHRPIGGTGRFCFACRRPILRGHKWHVIGCYLVHDDCQNPTMRALFDVPDDAALYSEDEGNEHAHAALDGDDHPAHGDDSGDQARALAGEEGTA